MYQTIYQCETTDHTGKPYVRMEAIVTHDEGHADRLLQHWAAQGRNTGHRYTKVSVKPYTGDINSVSWYTSVASYAHLRKEQIQ